MGAFSFKHTVEDIADAFRSYRLKTVLCCLVAVVGAIVGIIFFKISNYNWWYCNRYLFAQKLIYGGFFTIFLSYLLSAALIGFMLCAALLGDWTKFLSYVTLFFVSLYFGANCCALCECGGIVLGVFYFVLLIAEQAVNMLCCFVADCNCVCKRSFKEAIFDNRLCLGLQFLAIFVKLLIIFLLLRTLTALI